MSNASQIQPSSSSRSVRRAEIMLIRLLALEISRTVESMAVGARAMATRRLSTGQLSRTLSALQKDLDHLTPLIRSLTDTGQGVGIQKGDPRTELDPERR